MTTPTTCLTTGAARLVGPDSPERAETEAFIAAVYRARYGAELTHFLPQLLAYRDVAGRLTAAVGWRGGAHGRLFVENYLDGHVEDALADALGRPVLRGSLVEVGNFAAVGAGDARAVIVDVTHLLHAAGLRWVLFTATRQLRNAFERLGLVPTPLAPARPDRLTDGGAHWGSYYQTQPQLMFGDIAAGHACLTRRTRAVQACCAAQIASAGSP
ncbi:MAG TPA: thermostable hemolysin [Dokdonella sp.]|uniref:thermostable hemolysin n=1 Tax=Dokdonella sp. TaxID=2291710 RepID=UPI002BE0F411|nr:thermostable hemolysin [Dokdonella sp.]HUD40869.1 thermostable hemolysin [Dokdonella sp.]